MDVLRRHIINQNIIIWIKTYPFIKINCVMFPLISISDDLEVCSLGLNQVEDVKEINMDSQLWLSEIPLEVTSRLSQFLELWEMYLGSFPEVLNISGGLIAHQAWAIQYKTF